MKLKLLSLAVIAAALPTTGALAAGHSGGHSGGPTVYGQIDVGVSRTDNGTTDQFNVQDNASRLGVKGEEDLGGITGFYQFEFAVDTSDGDGGVLNGRDVFVGLKGDFGKVYVGRFDTPFKKAQNKVDLFSDQYDMKNYVAGEEREKSAIGYSTPDMGGIAFNIMLQPGEGATDNVAEVQDGVADAISMSVSYDSDGLFGSLSYDMNVDYGFWDSVAGISDGDLSDALRLVGVVKMDNYGFGGLFQTAEQSDIATPADQTAFVLSAYAMMDQTKFEFQFAQSNHEKGAAEIDIDFLGLGAEQHLSKRTNLYAMLGMRTVDVGGTETDSDIFMVGAKHKF